jgi:hypothetical protein
LPAAGLGQKMAFYLSGASWNLSRTRFHSARALSILICQKKPGTPHFAWRNTGLWVQDLWPFELFFFVPVEENSLC